MNFSEAINLLFLIMTFVDLTKSYSLVNTRKGSLCMTKCQPYNGYYWCYYDYVIYEEYSNLFILYLQNSLKTHTFSQLLFSSLGILFSKRNDYYLWRKMCQRLWKLWIFVYLV